MSHLAIIPARSGSKGLPDKNIKQLNGKPLMAWTIEAALKSECFDEVMVSTDSKVYAQIAGQYGAGVPFLRSDKTSSDTASSWDMVREVLEKYRAIGRQFDYFTLLQPTSPLRTAKDIAGAWKEMKEKAAGAVIGVCPAEHSPELINTLPENKSMSDFFGEGSGIFRRQDKPIYYRINGSIYMMRVDFFEAEDSFYREGCFAYCMENAHSIDIDNLQDFMIAEYIMKTTI